MDDRELDNRLTYLKNLIEAIALKVGAVEEDKTIQEKQK